MAHERRVVHRELVLAGETLCGGGGADGAAGELAVVRDEQHGDRCDGGLRLDEHLDAAAARHPLRQRLERRPPRGTRAFPSGLSGEPAHHRPSSTGITPTANRGRSAYPDVLNPVSTIQSVSSAI